MQRIVNSKETQKAGKEGQKYQVEAEETPALAVTNENPKEGVKTENNDDVILKVVGQDGSVVQFKIKGHTPLSKPIVNDRVCQ
ncbi:hypothetical protein QTO34_017849 [Cnephaeus nilssonii]|uniref:Uncharacterized protein n=1 Tax=Cnephaeus nilssonii TaxID=3371016 RepID=A0AA40LRN1_CNENI|nr:hypothetical protein QTO34_017849 [Eptesicus nilssonii]